VRRRDTQASTITILGVDPGLANTGYAVLQAGNGSLRVLESGLARTPARQSVEARLQTIYDELADVLTRWHPVVTVLEGLYSEYSYPRTAILMGHVRGVICLAAHQNGARVLELAPAEAKRAVTGSGRADKDQIRRAVTRMLRLPEPPSSTHVCDALALALVGAAREGISLVSG
jgi:crossover junction endodeoxyribonuclease RuvC